MIFLTGNNYYLTKAAKHQNDVTILKKMNNVVITNWHRGRTSLLVCLNVLKDFFSSKKQVYSNCSNTNHLLHSNL
jgi:hypothetical protein